MMKEIISIWQSEAKAGQDALTESSIIVPAETQLRG